MSALPLVSVVIPTFNRGYCIARAVESILAQTFQDFEIIVVNNCSTDDTADVLARFGDRIRVVYPAIHGRVGASRNTGIRAARGKWIAFNDSDDVWLPDKLRQQMQALEKHAARACFSHCVADNGEPFLELADLSSTTLEPGIHHLDRSGALDCVAKARHHPFIQSAVIDRALLEQAGVFDESLFAAEDTLLIFRLAFLTDFLFIAEPSVVIYRDSPDSLTYDPQSQSVLRRYQAYTRVRSEVYWRLLETYPEKAALPRLGLAHYVSRWAELACMSGQDSAAHALAWDGLVLTADWRTRIRNAWLYLLPGLYCRHYGKRQKQQG